MDSGRANPQHRREVPARRAVELSQSSPPPTASLRREGEYWTIAFAGSAMRLRDSKGLGYLAQLVRYPEHSFFALDLLAPGPPPDSIRHQHSFERTRLDDESVHYRADDSAGQMLDQRAKRAYHDRIAELRSELEASKSLGKTHEAERAEREIEALTRELARAVGLAGRDRRAASVAERARINVGRAIRSAIDRIERTGSALGTILRATVKTGSFCRYSPDPNRPLVWHVSTDPLPAFADEAGATHFEQEADYHFLTPFPASTAFVGRDTELRGLEGLLDSAIKGRGSLGLIGGNPGVGKTRLAAELAALGAKRRAIILTGHCYERDGTSPYHPFVEALEIVQARLPQPDLRLALGEHAPEISRLVPYLRRLFPDIELSAALPPEQARRSLFAAVCGFLSRLAAERGLILIIDDLQWADQSSLLLLSYLARRIAELRMFVVGTYTDVALENNSPLAMTIEEFVRARRVNRVRLRGLSRDLTARMLEALAGQPAPQPLVDAVFDETDGNPFFIEEVFRHLTEEGLLFDDKHRFLANLRIDELDVPENVRLVVGRRLNRLDRATQSILAAGAVIGRVFSFELLVSLTGADSEHVLESIDEAERAGIVRSIPDPSESRLSFAHELIRQTLISQMSGPRRQRIHLAVADAMERIYTVATEDHAADLAHHLVAAGRAAQPLRTLRYLAAAAQQASGRSAYSEALKLQNVALEIARRLPERRARLHQELELRCAMQLPLLVNEGFSSQTLEESNLRVLELCGNVSDHSSVFSALAGVWNIAVDGGNLTRAREVSDRMMRLIDDSSPSSLQVQANYAVGSTMFFSGDLSKACAHFDKVASVYDPAEHGILYRSFVSEPGVVSLAHGALVLWRLGFPDQALRTCERAVKLAREIAHPASLAHALFHAAEIRQLRGDCDRVAEPAEESISLSTERGFTYWLGLSTATLGAAHVAQGQVGEGIDRIVRGIEIFAGTGTQLDLPYATRILAEAYLKASRPDDALSAIDRALAAVERSGARLEEAELCRLRGEAMLAKVLTNDVEATAWFERAIRVARPQSARSWELRAASSLARLCSTAGDRDQARAMLTAIYDWFTEGFDTADLRSAKAILAELPSC